MATVTIDSMHVNQIHNSLFKIITWFSVFMSIIPKVFFGFYTGKKLLFNETNGSLLTAYL